jgi:hypothetical protein
MANSSSILDWCVARIGDDNNWWVDEVSDPVRWDTDGLSIIDPRQVAHLIEMVEPLRDYGFDQDMMESAFIPFRIEKEAATGKLRLKRVKDSIFESDEKLFALADIVDEENGPYADLIDHLTRCRVKMLNDVYKFESKLTVDEVEDEIREDQNASFIEGKAIHAFDELLTILDYTPAGFDEDDDEEGGKRAKKGADDTDDEDIDTDDLPEVADEDDEALKGDASLKWDEDDEDADADDAKKKDGAEEEDDDKDADDSDDEDKPKAKKKPAPKKKR